MINERIKNECIKADSLSDTNPAVVRDTAMVRALFDQKQLNMLVPFFQAPVSVTDASIQTNTLPTTMLGFVRRLERGGLIHEVESVRRSGKDIRLYKTVADQFFVPIDAAEEILLSPETYYQKRFNESLRAEILRYHYTVKPIGALFECLPSGIMQIRGTRDDGFEWEPGLTAPLVHFHWSVLHLDPHDAIALQAELDAVIAKYKDKPDGERALYVGAHFAPVLPVGQK
jgi:hypothetical protein